MVATFWRTPRGRLRYIRSPCCWALFRCSGSRPWLDFFLLCGLHLIVHEGLWRSLVRFPWDTEGALIDLRLIQTTDPNPPCGWFFDRFHRDVGRANEISRIDAVLGCMLGSWWLFVVSSLVEPERSDGVLIASAGAAMTMTPLGRLAIYHEGCRPPITCGGRIATFRWIIPGYDQVLVGPICSFLTMPTVLFVFRNSGVPDEILLSAMAPD